MSVHILVWLNAVQLTAARPQTDDVVVEQLLIYSRSLITIRYGSRTRTPTRRNRNTETTFICPVARRRTRCRNFAVQTIDREPVRLSVNTAALTPTTYIAVIYSHICRHIKPPTVTAAAKTDARRPPKKFSCRAAGVRSTLFSYRPSISRENWIKFWTCGLCHSINICSIRSSIGSTVECSTFEGYQ